MCMGRTNIVLDDRLVVEGLRLTKLHSKKDLVNEALVQLVKRLRRKKLIDLRGKVKWEGDLSQMRKLR